MQPTLYELNEESIKKFAPRKSGVYKIYINEFVPRIKGETNLVYIGKANSNLRARLMTFPNGFTFCNEYPNKELNIETNRMVYPVFPARHGVRRFWHLLNYGFLLSFEFIESTDPESLEKDEIEAFEEAHLELPPLNHAN